MKSNKWRNWALVYMFSGFFIMYIGVYVRSLLPYLIPIGGLGVVAGILLYFRFGPVNKSIQETECPRCGQMTRLIGDHDSCSHCGQSLRKTNTGTYEPYVKS
jgi:ribosomal protein L37E